MCDLLKAHGLVAARRGARRIAPAIPLAAVTGANATWTTDFKGEFRTEDGIYCYPLTLRDAFSRFVLRCDALPGRTYEATRRCFERAFAKYGLPDRMRSDNGGPFASTSLGRLSRLSVWWIRLGILPERIALGRPEQNGAHEQFHGVLKAETTWPPAGDRRAQHRRFARFCREYNYDRPHETLNNEVPATRYTASTRPWPRRVPPIEYPGHVEVRRASARCPGRARRCFSRSRSSAKTSPSKRSTTTSGRSVWPRSRSGATTAGGAEFILWPRSRRGAPPAPLAPRLTLKTKTNDQNPRSTVTHVSGLICYPCVRLLSP